MCARRLGISTATQADGQRDGPWFAVRRPPIERNHCRGPIVGQKGVDLVGPTGSEALLQTRNERVVRGRGCGGRKSNRRNKRGNDGAREA